MTMGEVLISFELLAVICIGSFMFCSLSFSTRLIDSMMEEKAEWDQVRNGREEGKEEVMR